MKKYILLVFLSVLVITMLYGCGNGKEETELIIESVK